jgi:hypothetical protein
MEAADVEIQIGQVKRKALLATVGRSPRTRAPLGSRAPAPPRPPRHFCLLPFDF